MQINAGSSSGVRLDDPVITGDGLAGRISQVTHGTAEVTLITDHTSSVAARVEPVGATGVVEPEVGDPNDLVLDYLENANGIAETQTVVTAGFATGGARFAVPAGDPDRRDLRRLARGARRLPARAR